MQVSDARYEGFKLILSTVSPDARKFVYQFKPGDYEISKSKKRRSLDANGYCWALCTQIAAAVGITKDDVYRRAISEGNQYASVTLLPDAVEAFKRAWASRGIGWIAEVIDDAPDGNKLLFAYYGSSAYDTRQMAELIDRLVQDAKALDIETLSERELSLLKDGWDAQKD